MNHKIILFAFLFAITLETPTLPNSISPDNKNQIIREELWLPMDDNSKYGKDICHYKEIDEELDYEIHYAKPCKEGQYCDNLGIDGQPFNICRDLPEYIKLAELKEKCDESKDCVNDLSCIDGICTKKCSTNQDVYHMYNGKYRCYESKSITSDNICYENTYKYDNNNLYAYDHDEKYGTFKDASKKCGKINPIEVTIHAANSNNKNKKYLIKSKELVSFGEVEDGDFVTDASYCKSGFALYFYLNGKVTNPGEVDPTHSSDTNCMFLRCVTPVKIDPNRKVIAYKIGEGNEENYNTHNIGTSHKVYSEGYTGDPDTGDPDEGSSPNSIDFDDLGIEYAIIRNEIMKEYLEAFKDLEDEEKENCIEDFKNRCTNADVVRAVYFYNHPDEYLFYNDRKKLKKVLNYKIQDQYHSFSSTKFINLNYLVLLLTLLLI